MATIISSERSRQMATMSSGPMPSGDQLPGQLIGAGVEFGIAPSAILEQQRDVVRRLADLSLEQVHQRFLRQRSCGVIERRERAADALRRTESLADAAAAKDRRRSVPADAPAAPRMRSADARSNRSALYSSSPVSPAGWPAASCVSVKLKVRSNLVVRVPTDSGVALTPGNSRRGCSLFCNTSMV